MRMQSTEICHHAMFCDEIIRHMLNVAALKASLLVGVIPVAVCVMPGQAGAGRVPASGLVSASGGSARAARAAYPRQAGRAGDAARPTWHIPRSSPLWALAA
jgi:hypothetical protein